jgi:hypothetical protein
MNLSSVINNGGTVGNAGAVELGGSDKAASVNFEVGAVGFGPAWGDEPSLRELYEIACQTIVRQDCELSEANARIAVLEAEQAIFKNKIDCLRDEACRESCRDKAAADGWWANI